MARRLGQDQFTVIRAPLVQSPRDGSFYRDWENATHTLVLNANIQPFKLSEKLEKEDDQGREFGKSGRRFFAPPNTDVQYTDRILYLHEVYDVLGHPGYWTNFRGEVDHVAFIAQRREG